ncbi:O-antigen ligase family protein [Bacteroidota bacterium]
MLNILKAILIILVHFGIGLISTSKNIPLLYGLLVLSVGFVHIFIKHNRGHLVLFYAGYLTSLEVFLRMTGGVVFYEYGKYGVILLLILGIVMKKEFRPVVVVYFFYLMLLLVGISLSDAANETLIRKQIAFNLSGPFVLGFSAIYFYKQKISKKILINALYWMLIPIFSMLGYLYIRTPDIREIAFGGAANAKMSGGFGPNQVATILGFGVFLLMLLLSQKKRVSGVFSLDLVLLAYMLYRGIMTFSRGGIIAGLLAFIVFIFFILIHQKKILMNLLKYFSIGSVIIIGVWIYSTEVTNGMIINRFTGKNANGTEKEDVTSGRLDIIENQLERFYDSPILGIGVGNGKQREMDNFGETQVASHNEIFRLLEEHGVIGLLLLFVLFLVPLENIYFSNLYAKGFLCAFYFLWLLTINHSAMRIAFPGFIYGLSLIRISQDEDGQSEVLE